MVVKHDEKAVVGKVGEVDEREFLATLVEVYAEWSRLSWVTVAGESRVGFSSLRRGHVDIPTRDQARAAFARSRYLREGSWPLCIFRVYARSTA